MRENCTSGSVRGASGNRGSYRKRATGRVMKNLIGVVLGMLIWAGGFSITIAALLVLDASLPVKLLIGSGFGFLGLLFYRLENVESSLHRLVIQAAYFSRVSFIASETNRTNPSDTRPAQDIASEDIARENETEQIERSLGANRIEIGLVVYGGFALATAVATYFLFNWLRNHA
jgi:hypothetical protein